MATFIKRPTFTSPKGSFKFPSLSKPDFGNEKFPKPDGEYKTGLVVSRKDAQPLIDVLRPLWLDAIKAGQADFAKLTKQQREKLGQIKGQMFYQTEFDSETEEETGNVIFNFKTKYKILDKKTREVRHNTIGLFDAKGKPLAAGTAIYGGTTGKLSFQVSPYFIPASGLAGVTLRLGAAQIIDLVGPGARSSKQYGFGEEEGYETESTPAEKAGFDEEETSTAGANGNPQDF